MFTRAAGMAGVAALILACGGPDESPFFLWDIRPGMPVDSVERFLVRHDELRPDEHMWERCDPLDAGARRCEHKTALPWGRLQIVVASDSRVLYLAFAPGTRDTVFDDSLSAMQRRWARAKGVQMDSHGVSEATPKGIAEFRSGRWRALMTFDGKVCAGTNRPCPALVQLLDWGAGRKYADMSSPHDLPPCRGLVAGAGRTRAGAEPCQPVDRTSRPTARKGAVAASAPQTTARPRYSDSSNGPMACTILS